MTSKELKMTAHHWLSVPLVFLLFLGPHITLANPINRQVGISENVFITVQNDTYGNEQRVCSIDSVTYVDGDSIPTSSPCEHCICRPPGFACTIISCEYRPGCKALKRSDQCCPEYQCECEKDGKIYQNGEKILDNNNPCEVCYCQGGDVICAVIDCYWRNDCQPRYIENRCCPLYDHCPPPSEPGPTRPTIPTTTPVESSSFSWFNLSSAVYEVSTKPSTTTTTSTALPESSTSTSSVAPESSTMMASSPAEALVSSQEPSQAPVTQAAVVSEEPVVSDVGVVNDNNIDQPSPPTQSQVTSPPEKPAAESTQVIQPNESIAPSTTLINFVPILLTISPSPVDQATTLPPTQVAVSSSTTLTPEEIQRDPEAEPETVIQSENTISDKEVLVSSQNSQATEILSSSVTSLLTETISAAVVSTPVVQQGMVDTQINIQSSPALSDIGVQTTTVVVTTTEVAAQDLPVTEEYQQQEQQDAGIEEDRITTVSTSLLNSQSEVEALNTEPEVTTALPPVVAEEIVHDEKTKPIEISTQQSNSVATEEAHVISDDVKVETVPETPTGELVPPKQEQVQQNDQVDEVVTTNAPLQDNIVVHELPSQELELPNSEPEKITQDEPVPTTQGPVEKSQDENEQADETSNPTTQSVLNLNDEQVASIVDSKPVVQDVPVVGIQNDVPEITDSPAANDEGSILEATSESSLSSKAPMAEAVPTEISQADEEVTNAQDIVSDDSATQTINDGVPTDSPIIFVVAPGKEGFYVSVPAKEPQSLQDVPAVTSSPESEPLAQQDSAAATSPPEKESEQLEDNPETTLLPENISEALQDTPEVTSAPNKENLSLEDEPQQPIIPQKEFEIVEDAPAITQQPEILQDVPAITQQPETLQDNPEITQQPEILQDGPAITQQPEILQDVPVVTSTPEKDAVIFEDAPSVASVHEKEHEIVQDAPVVTAVPELNNDQPATEIPQQPENVKPAADFVVNLVDDDTFEILPVNDEVQKIPVILNQIKEEQKITEDIVKPEEQKAPIDVEKPSEINVEIVQDEPSPTTVRIDIKGDKEEDTDGKDGDEDTIEVSGANSLINQISADESNISATTAPLTSEIKIESNKQPLIPVVPVAEENLSEAAVEIFSDAAEATTVPAEIIAQNIKTDVEDESPHSVAESLADQTVLVEGLPEHIINADSTEVVEETTGKINNVQLSDEPVVTTVSTADALEDEPNQSNDAGATNAPLVNVNIVPVGEIDTPLADQAVEIENVQVHKVQNANTDDELPLADQAVEIENVVAHKIDHEKVEAAVPLADQAVQIDNIQQDKIENSNAETALPLADQTAVIENDQVQADENIVATTPQENDKLNSEPELSHVQLDEPVVTTSQPKTSDQVAGNEESSLADEVVEVHNVKLEAADERVSDESVATTVEPESAIPINKVQKVAMVTAAKVSPVVEADEKVVNDQPSESATVKAAQSEVSSGESTESKFRLDMSIFDDSVEENVKSVEVPVVKVKVAEQDNEIEKNEIKNPIKINSPVEESKVIVKNESPEVKESQDEPAVVVATTPSIIAVQRGDGIANNDEILVFDEEQQTATHLPVAQSLHREEHSPSVQTQHSSSVKAEPSPSVQVEQSPSVQVHSPTVPLKEETKEAEKTADEPEHIPTTESYQKLSRDDIDFSGEVVEITTVAAARLNNPIVENIEQNDEPVPTGRSDIEIEELPKSQEKTEEISTLGPVQDEPVTQAQQLRGEEIKVEIAVTNNPIENEINNKKSDNVEVELNDEQIATTASFLLRHHIVAGDETTIGSILQDENQESQGTTGASNIHGLDNEIVQFDEVVATSTEKIVHAERQDFVEVTTTQENGRYAAQFHDDVYGTTTYPINRRRQEAIVHDEATTERIVRDDTDAQNEIVTNNPSVRQDAEEADGSFSDGTTVDSDLAAVDADDPLESTVAPVVHDEPQKAELVQFEEVATTTAAASVKNESVTSKTEASSIADNVEIPRISEDMRRSDINSIMSELNLKGRMSHEVSQVEEPWLWRTYNRIRNLSFFPRLTRQPRSADDEEKEKKNPGKIYPKTKKATQELPKETHKKVKLPSRSFLLW